MPEIVSFKKSKIDYEVKDLLELQIKSFEKFFQLGTTYEQRKNEGLFQVFQENFPVTDTKNIFILEFLDYTIDPPRYTEEECKERGLTYSVSLKVKFKLSCTDPEHVDFKTVVEEVYLGQIPYMTKRGTFIFNGIERVIVSQLHRSPGVFFGQTFHQNGTKLYSARVIPIKGSWIEFSTDVNNVMYAYIDRKKKLPVTTLLRALGYETDKDILNLFQLAEEVVVNKQTIKNYIGRKLAGRVVRSWWEDFTDEDTGVTTSIKRHEILIERDTELTKEHIKIILDNNIPTILLHKTDINISDYAIIYNTLQKDPCNTQQEAQAYIYRLLRNNEPPDEETAKTTFENIFLSTKKYDLGEVGRYKINKKLKLDIPNDVRVLTKEDIVEIIKYLIELESSKADVDDIDHLSNRRVRTVGEQIKEQFSAGIARMARTIKEKMNVRDNEVFTPSELVNSKILTSVLNTFFGTNQLSQFLDQTNPLAEMTHKRRISALGQGGLTREHAGFEVRDVHYTHYGRLCPIETPEGPNIGLISSLCVYAKVNQLGFIETPYRKVKNGVITNEIVYLSAEEEEDKVIAQSTVKTDENLNITQQRISVRKKGDFITVSKEEIDYIDVASNQILSVAASLIPFLEHDDANRALMGSNMMRQAVPLLIPEAPIVATSMEKHIALNSGFIITAEYDGIVEYVDSCQIKIKYDIPEEEALTRFEDNIVTYNLLKFFRTNQNTVINLKPIVKVGERVKKGQPLVDGYATHNGELALGKNILVAFMPWRGYNFEDAIVISERLVRDDVFTSIHIQEFTLDVRDTGRGFEELTSDIPNVSEEATKNLDENGLIRVGAYVKPGDILIGKITPKGESEPTPEEKLLIAIFGDKARNVKDASLRVPPGLYGIVIDKKLFSRRVKDKKQKSSINELIDKYTKEEKNEYKKLKELLINKLDFVLNSRVCQGVKDYNGNEVIKKGEKFNKKLLEKIDYFNVNPNGWTASKDRNQLVVKIITNYIKKYKEIEVKYKRKKLSLTVGDELPLGVVKLAKVYVAEKRPIKVGDKLAGRHGNKGVISKIVRIEDMPFLEDGTPVDIVLNPLGVPSRMNLGQIYETILGWVGKKLNIRFITPSFDGATIEEIEEYCKKANIPLFGKTYLYDGLTGERFEQPTTVGVIYMMKLIHMVDDKIHARSIGPYSLITQQPLGGKAQFGGQRFGEMEVWALEAFGAAHTLQEMLTYKSDDIEGRQKVYECIVKGEPLPEPGIPESFKVLVNELKGLALNIKFEN